MGSLTEIQSDDLLNFICGTKLGEGTFRTVFESVIDSTKVIKMDNMRNFSNVQEFQFWDHYKDTELAIWLAPCYQLSGYGVWLMQAKTEPIPSHLLPSKVPAILADLKASNWGFYEGRPVCHDYGNNYLHSEAKKTGTKLVSAKWHDGSNPDVDR